MAIFIAQAAQISTQQPLSEEWFDEPVLHFERYRRSVEADYKQFLTPMAARRMGLILRRAVATSVTVVNRSGIAEPDAVICGTGLGCIENTEKFLTAMVEEGEWCLQPTYFINSTHNTIASHIATHLHCHGYNSTYAHLGLSFESALLDAVMQFESGKIASALVGGHDELTPAYFALLDRVGYWKKSVDRQTVTDSLGEGSLAGETAVSVMLSNSGGGVELCDVRLCYRPQHLEEQITDFLERNATKCSDVDLIVTGRNGDCRYDGVYDNVVERLFAGRQQAWYKHLFGESYTASAFGLYAAREMMLRRRVADVLSFGGVAECRVPRVVLLVNGFESREYSLILLRYV